MTPAQTIAPRTRAPGATGRCETCAHWSAREKGCSGATVNRSIIGYCHRNCLRTFCSGHCGLYEVLRKAVAV